LHRIWGRRIEAGLGRLDGVRDRVVLLAGLPVVLYAALLLLVPAAYISFDEAKYIAIGRNVLQGNGPITDFGELFLPHSPTWPMILAAPNLAFGIPSLDVGHAVNFVAVLVVLAMTYRLAARIDRVAAVVAVIALASWAMLFDLSRTARLDVPQAALCLVYLEVGIWATQRSPIRRGLVAGAVLALAFLVKESSLVLAPMPLLAALVEGRSFRSVARVGAMTILVFVIATAWWFEWVLILSDRVYAVGLPGSALGPLAVVVVLAAVGFLVAGTDRAGLWLAGIRQRHPVGRARKARLAVALGFSVVWALILGVGFAHSSVLASQPIINLGQIDRYYHTYRGDLAATVLFGLGGAMGLALFSRSNPRLALPLLGLIASSSWALLVVATGEPPRDLVAQIALFDGLAAVGWVAAARAVLRWTPARRRLAGAAMGIGVVAVTVLAGHDIERLARSGLTAPGDTTRALATQTISDWLSAHEPAGSTVAFGAVEGEETSVNLDGRFRLTLLAPGLAVFDANAADGLATPGGQRSVVWVAVDRHPREDAFYALTAATAQATLSDPNLRAVVYVTGLATASPSVLPLLLHSRGLVESATWRWPYGSGNLVVDVFTVTPNLVQVPTSRLYIQSDALSVILQRLAGHPGAPAIAQQLLRRVTLSPGSESDAATLARLRQMAGQQ